MSKKRRQSYNGCSLEARRGELRLRFRAVGPDGVRRHLARAIGLPDTPENRAALRPLAKLVGAAIEAGKTIAEVDGIVGRPTKLATTHAADDAKRARLPAPTVADY